jgi:hypothetical protein
MKQDVFVSKPNGLNNQQNQFWKALEEIMQEREMTIRSIGYSDYSFKSPLRKVQEVMQECEGAVILGFHQKRIRDGEDREGGSLSDYYLPTPWNHIEAGMAYMLDHPMLIILEKGVLDEGIFDAKSNDSYIMETELNVDWLKSEEFLQPLAEWEKALLD